MSSGPRGLLLVNLGTPDSAGEADVRRYLGEFLMDPWVIDIAYPLRWLLIHGLILRTRPAKSAEAYAQVWTERGSPLLFHLQDLLEQVRKLADPARWRIAAGMRYGKPGIPAALAELKAQGVREALVFPLYPQYSLAATRSSVEWALGHAEGMALRFAPAFYAQEDFIAAFAKVAQESLRGFAFDHLLFSFHGLPERQVRKTDRSPGRSHCLQQASCCETIGEANRDCYRAQCHATAAALARALGLRPGQSSVSFQSRLGRTPWIQPFTDIRYGELARAGVRRLAVMCPAFVADCLETLEEIQIRGRRDFIQQGGEELRLVPSLNSEPAWAQAVLTIAERSRPA